MKIAHREIVITALFMIAFLLRVVFLGWGSEQSEITNYTLLSIIQPVQHYLIIIADRLLPQPQASLLTGVVFGIQTSLPADFKNALQNTSTIHIVVASGQNLTMLAGFMLSFARFLGRKRIIAISLGTIIAYSFITGFQLPIIRAAIMIIFSLLAQTVGRETSPVRGLSIAAGLMVLFNPEWLTSVSFQLSFLATLATLVVSPLVLHLFDFLPEVVKEDISISASVQLLTWPVIAIAFHQISVVDIVVNSLVLWTVPLIMISGAITILFASFVPILGSILSFVPQALLTYFVYIITFFNQPWGVITVGDLSIVCIVGYYLVILGLFLWLYQRYTQSRRASESVLE